jgi:hypothetical protein
MGRASLANDVQAKIGKLIAEGLRAYRISRLLKIDHKSVVKTRADDRSRQRSKISHKRTPPHHGKKIMRFIFSDEGGISRNEPFVVVAGIVVRADEKLVPLEQELQYLIERHIPTEHRRGFVFHATEIWSGTGKIFKEPRAMAA